MKRVIMGMSEMTLGRRSLLQAGAGLAVAMVAPSGRAAEATAALNMQLGWLGGGNQLGEACAHQLGYFAEERLDFHLQPGGPNNDGIAIVASGRYEVGQVSSSPSLMLAASDDKERNEIVEELVRHAATGAIFLLRCTPSGVGFQLPLAIAVLSQNVGFKSG
jgi:ABC-type nitrate/sulfonate/bicarbonate transport system substrate-binding protein